tara:strand:- start:790 stop:1593 length:804 start_codon:yes stop_codon:yes gene_type:complete
VARIDFIGTGNAFAPSGRLHACICIDRKILVDLPPTIIPQLRRVGLDASSIDHVLITHWHGDHTFGSPFFFLDRKYLSKKVQKEPLEVHLRPGGEDLLTSLSTGAYPKSLDEFLSQEVRWNFEESAILEGTDWAFDRFPVKHTPETDPHGYLLLHKSGFNFLHCGDSGPCDGIESLAEIADVILLEMGVPDIGSFPYHHTPSDVIAFQGRHPGKTVLVTHNYSSANGIDTGFQRPELPPPIIQLEDGDSLVVSDDGTFTLVQSEGRP